MLGFRPFSVECSVSNMLNFHCNKWAGEVNMSDNVVNIL